MRIDRTGQTYGLLTALYDTGKRTAKGGWVWAARCSCGRVIETHKLGQKDGPTRCHECSTAAHGNRTHGHAVKQGSSTYQSWTSAKNRCRNPKNSGYPRYGAKGISVCERWQDFQNFLADMGPRPEGTSLGRILDRGDYEPGNAFWMTPAEQGLAQQNNHALQLWEESQAAFDLPVAA